jgi:hypothetical protein
MWCAVALMPFTTVAHFAHVQLAGSGFPTPRNSVPRTSAQRGSVSDQKGIVARSFGAVWWWWCRSVIRRVFRFATLAPVAQLNYRPPGITTA